MSIDDFNRFKAEQADRKFNRAQYDDITTEEWSELSAQLLANIKSRHDILNETHVRLEED